MASVPVSMSQMPKSIDISCRPLSDRFLLKIVSNVKVWTPEVILVWRALNTFHRLWAAARLARLFSSSRAPLASHAFANRLAVSAGSRQCTSHSHCRTLATLYGRLRFTELGYKACRVLVDCLSVWPEFELSNSRLGQNERERERWKWEKFASNLAKLVCSRELIRCWKKRKKKTKEIDKSQDSKWAIYLAKLTHIFFEATYFCLVRRRPVRCVWMHTKKQQQRWQRSANVDQ